MGSLALRALAIVLLVAPAAWAFGEGLELVHIETVVDKDGTYSAAMRDLACKSDVVAYPTSTAEVAAQIGAQLRAAAAAGVGLKVRASHKSFHSTAPFVCPGKAVTTFPDFTNTAVPLLKPAAAAAASPPPPGNATTMTLLLDNMTRVLRTNPEKHRMRVQTGMFITQLLEEAAAANMSLPLGAAVAFGDLTLGGVLVTGAHGTGHLTTSSLADIVVELTWVDGKGEVHTSKRDSKAGRALIGGLGVAGVVTELLLQLQPPTHVAVSTRFKQSDRHLLADVKAMLQDSPHVLVVWRPDLQQYTAHITREVPTSTPITGGIVNLDFPKIVAQALGKSIQIWQEDVHDLLPLAAVPVMAAVQETSVAHAMANKLGGGRMLEGVGDSNRMQATSCGKKCLWSLGSKIAMDDLHFSIEFEALGRWIDDVKSLIAADLWQHGLKRARFMSPGYVWLRFGKGSADFISHTSNMTAPVHVQLSYMKSVANPHVPVKYTWVLETLEQLTICKYKGKPHWGKNHERSFKHPTCHIRDHLPMWDKLADFAATSDPQRIFEPPLFAAMAARSGPTASPGCALRGQCFCSADEHCAAGFKCLPSLAFPEYSACRLPGLLG